MYLLLWICVIYARNLYSYNCLSSASRPFDKTLGLDTISPEDRRRDRRVHQIYIRKREYGRLIRHQPNQIMKDKTLHNIRWPSSQPNCIIANRCVEHVGPGSAFYLSYDLTIAD